MLNSKYTNITKKDAFCIMYHEEASKVKCFVMYSNIIAVYYMYLTLMRWGGLSFVFIKVSMC